MVLSKKKVFYSFTAASKEDLRITHCLVLQDMSTPVGLHLCIVCMSMEIILRWCFTRTEFRLRVRFIGSTVPLWNRSTSLRRFQLNIDGCPFSCKTWNSALRRIYFKKTLSDYLLAETVGPALLTSMDIVSAVNWHKP